MESITIEKPNSIEYKTITLATGFDKQSWGFIQAVKYGNLILISGSGIYANNAITQLTEFATINDISFYNTQVGYANYGTGIISIQTWLGGTNKLRIASGLPANTNFDFFILGMCN